MTGSQPKRKKEKAEPRQDKNQETMIPALPIDNLAACNALCRVFRCFKAAVQLTVAAKPESVIHAAGFIKSTLGNQIPTKINARSIKPY